jgi:predicted  nucleic acid-binding Zn-ribbon protein
MAVIAQKIDMMDARLSSGQERLAEGQVCLEGRMGQLGERQTRLEDQMGQLGERQTRLEGQMGQLGERQTRLEGRMDTLAEQQEKMQGDIVDIKTTMDVRFSIIDENNQVINRKLNALLAHMGAAE